MTYPWYVAAIALYVGVGALGRRLVPSEARAWAGSVIEKEVQMLWCVAVAVWVAVTGRETAAQRGDRWRGECEAYRDKGGRW